MKKKIISTILSFILIFSFSISSIADDSQSSTSSASLFITLPDANVENSAPRGPRLISPFDNNLIQIISGNLYDIIVNERNLKSEITLEELSGLPSLRILSPVLAGNFHVGIIPYYTNVRYVAGLHENGNNLPIGTRIRFNFRKSLMNGVIVPVNTSVYYEYPGYFELEVGENEVHILPYTMNYPSIFTNRIGGNYVEIINNSLFPHQFLDYTPSALHIIQLYDLLSVEIVYLPYGHAFTRDDLYFTLLKRSKVDYNLLPDPDTLPFPGLLPIPFPLAPLGEREYNYLPFVNTVLSALGTPGQLTIPGSDFRATEATTFSISINPMPSDVRIFTLETIEYENLPVYNNDNSFLGEFPTTSFQFGDGLEYAEFQAGGRISSSQPGGYMLNRAFSSDITHTRLDAKLSGFTLGGTALPFVPSSILNLNYQVLNPFVGSWGNLDVDNFQSGSYSTTSLVPGGSSNTMFDFSRELKFFSIVNPTLDLGSGAIIPGQIQAELHLQIVSSPDS